MPLNSRRLRVDRIAAELQRRHAAPEDHRALLAVAGLSSAACVADATGRPVSQETLRRLRTRLDALPADDRASVLAEARTGIAAASSAADLPARLAELERLAMALQIEGQSVSSRDATKDQHHADGE